MLAELHIENFALIERLDLQLSSGLNVLTGETGAGKSIIIDAVSLLLGGRGSQEFIRSGQEKVYVEGVFTLKQESPIYARLQELGYELEDGTLLLSRELSVSGRNTCRVQGRTVPLSLYKEIGSLLVDIHGQHDYQSLLRPESHLGLLDSLAEGSLPLEGVLDISKQVIEVQKRLQNLTGGGKDTARREDMLRFQVEEISKAQLSSGEEEELLQERILLVNGEKLTTLVQDAYERLFSGFERQQSALDLAGKALSKLKDIAAIDPKAFSMLEALEGAYYQIEEVSRELRDYEETITFDSSRQEYVEDRLALIKGLKRKYGDSITEIAAYYEQVVGELEQLAGFEKLVSTLQAELTQLEAAYSKKAEELTTARLEVAAGIERRVIGELADLNMPATRFKVEFSKREKVHKLGQDLVEFMFSPNPGEPVKPLSKTASGGELSRVILSLKTILAKIDPVPTLIFDEVDSGVGGAAVRKMAEKLAHIGETRQVLCVTHSPQVASFADKHFFIAKDVYDERTITRVTLLAEEERSLELARMLGGTISKVTLEHAKEMLKMANRH
jgi:DNA repair protein RecN (Recombination protein N)